jgi:hypothetical protein
VTAPGTCSFDVFEKFFRSLNQALGKEAWTCHMGVIGFLREMCLL